MLPLISNTNELVSVNQSQSTRTQRAPPWQCQLSRLDLGSDKLIESNQALTNNGKCHLSRTEERRQSIWPI